MTDETDRKHCEDLKLGKYLAIVAVAAILAFTVGILYKRNVCESFWNEKCTIVLAPQSIVPMFSDSYYVKYKDDVKSLPVPTPVVATVAP